MRRAGLRWEVGNEGKMRKAEDKMFVKGALEQVFFCTPVRFHQKCRFMAIKPLTVQSNTYCCSIAHCSERSCWTETMKIIDLNKWNKSDGLGGAKNKNQYLYKNKLPQTTGLGQSNTPSAVYDAQPHAHIHPLNCPVLYPIHGYISAHVFAFFPGQYSVYITLCWFVFGSFLWEQAGCRHGECVSVRVRVWKRESLPLAWLY